MYRDGDQSEYLLDGWEKQTNEADADWMDLDALLGRVSMLEPDDRGYLSDMQRVGDVEQWLRWFAVMTLMPSQQPIGATLAGPRNLYMGGGCKKRSMRG